MPQDISIFWFRRDLRLHDNAGLYHALKTGMPVLPIFIFDTEILNKLADKADKRVEFIHNTLAQLKLELEQLGSSLKVYYGNPIEIWKNIVNEYKVAKVFTNHDYEPYAIERDETVKQLLASFGAQLQTYKDHVVFEKHEVVKENGEPYTVYTPYSKVWKARVNDFYLKPYPTQKYYSNLYKTPSFDFVSLDAMGFSRTNAVFPPTSVNKGLIKNYENTRDFPGIEGTSRLSLHFRFGTVSIREKMAAAKLLSEKYYNELIWREFYSSILWHFPRVIHGAFKKEYDAIKWDNNEEYFDKWCKGKTGYPLVDAGMRELNQTGHMHNRTRMVVASFLTKHLLIDWCWGEAYFAKKLLDFELASNNGGWQWAAGCGVDAAPYFRIFNPEIQLNKFDPNFIYVRKWVPEFGTPLYPRPIVNHVEAREKCLERYKAVLKPA